MVIEVNHSGAHSIFMATRPLVFFFKSGLDFQDQVEH